MSQISRKKERDVLRFEKEEIEKKRSLYLGAFVARMSHPLRGEKMLLLASLCKKGMNSWTWLRIAVRRGDGRRGRDREGKGVGWGAGRGRERRRRSIQTMTVATSGNSKVCWVAACVRVCVCV